MLLRPYQEAAINDPCKALDKHKNTIVVAPTGAGKTIMLSALVGKRYEDGKKVLVMHHREYSAAFPIFDSAVYNTRCDVWVKTLV